MLAEITLSKGRVVSPLASLALYSSERTASSPRTAYFACLMCGFILLMFRLRRGVEVVMLRDVGLSNWKDSIVVEGLNLSGDRAC